MARRLTIKQQKFVAFVLGAARGNATLAARLSGYAGDDRQLAVQGSVNMRNEKIQQLIKERLEAMVEPGLSALAAGLHATKRRAFLLKDGTIRYTDPEPDFRVTTATAGRILHHYERTTKGDPADPEAEVPPAPQDDAEFQEGVADEGKTDSRTEDSTGGQSEPADRVVLEQLANIEAELTEVDRELAHGADGSDGSDQ